MRKGTNLRRAAVLIPMLVLPPGGGAAVSSTDTPFSPEIGYSSSHQISISPPGLRYLGDGRPKKRMIPRAASVQAGTVSETGRQILEGMAGEVGNPAFAMREASFSPPADAQRKDLRHFPGIGEARIRFHPRNGTPTYIRFEQPWSGVLSAASRSDAEAVARHFLFEQRHLLGLDEPDRELKLLNLDRDAEGRAHLRFQQMWRGIPLWGRQLMVHLDSRNRIYLVNGLYEPTPKGVDVEPRVTAEEALMEVKRHLGGRRFDLLGKNLVLFYGEKGVARLAYRLDVRVGLAQRWRYFIDAMNGTRLHHVRNVHGGRIVGAQGVDAKGEVRRFIAWQDGETYYLLDPTRPENDVDATTDPLNRPEPKGDMLIFDARNGEDQLWHVTSSRLDEGWDPVAVSAAHNTRRVYEYYRDTFGRKSIDDKQMNLMVVIHFGQGYPNAFWNGVAMVYGDGDGRDFSPLVRCLDVAAHEMTHGVIEHTANLRYENQSGALNESFADFFGVMVDRDDWLIGEECTLIEPGHLRDLRNPANGLEPQPSRMSEYRNLPNTEAGDWGGVHINSGIPNRAAYLTTVEIGREKAEQIYYRALRFYLTASSRFIDARRALVQAAVDLHGEGSPEVLAVKRAWDAVEVTEGSSGDSPSPRPEPVEPVAGDDLMIYLLPLDGAEEPVYERYLLYRQNLSHPGIEPLSDLLASYTRPAVYTSDTGTRYLFVGSDNNLHEVDERGRVRTLTNTGEIFSIAVSPDGRHLAYTTVDALDDQLHVVDLERREVRDYTIVLPDYQREGDASVGRVRYADSLDFDYSGEVILFDVLVCLSRPGDDCNPGDPDTGFNYWTIGLLDMSGPEGSFYYPFPAQNPLFDLGYPSFANNTRDVIVFDLQEYDEQYLSVQSSVVILDLEHQAIYPVKEFERSSRVSWGVPSFWGDDDHVTIQQPNADGRPVAVRIPLGEDENRWQGVPGRSERINEGLVAMPLMHRAGHRALNRRLEASVPVLDFGIIPAGSSRTLTVEFSNTGNAALEITSIQLRGSPLFSQSGVNAILPQGVRFPVDVVFSPPAGSNGVYTGELVITSNATPATVVVSVTGVATRFLEEKESGGALLGLLGLALLVPLVRRMARFSMR